MSAVEELATRLLQAAAEDTDEEALAAAVAVQQKVTRPVWLYVMDRARFFGFDDGTVCHVAAASNKWGLFRLFTATGANPMVRNGRCQLPSSVAAEAGNVCLAMHIRCLYEA